MTRIAVNAIELNVEDSGSGPALLLLHGFTGDATTWEPYLDALDGYRVIRVDVIGHGRSDSPDDFARYSMANTVTDLVALLDRLGITRTALLGYSMGGRLALHFALAAQDRLWALVLESASPGIESPAEREARVLADNALADSIGRDGMESFVDRWQDQALFASQRSLPPEAWDRQRRQRLSGSPQGLANSLRGMGAGTQDYLLSRLGELHIPTLLLAGAIDTRYAALAQAMHPLIAGSEVHVIPGAGHTAHLEQPGVFTPLLTTFLSHHPPYEGAASR